MFSILRVGVRPELQNSSIIKHATRVPTFNAALVKRCYSKKVPARSHKVPRIRYLFAVVMLSYGLLYFVTGKMTKKAPRTSFSEREFEQYERESGLKRRLKLVPAEKNDQYTFYAVPFAHDESKILKLLKNEMSEGKELKVIHPEQLIEKEMEEQGRYSYLLEDIKAQGRSLPRGLITALIKQEIQLFMNTTSGQFDTNLVLMNYPQTTEEAIKFENDVADVHECFVASADFDENLSTDLNADRVRQINNVVGYFDIVDKVKRA